MQSNGFSRRRARWKGDLQETLHLVDQKRRPLPLVDAVTLQRCRRRWRVDCPMQGHRSRMLCRLPSTLWPSPLLSLALHVARRPRWSSSPSLVALAGRSGWPHSTSLVALAGRLRRRRSLSLVALAVAGGPRCRSSPLLAALDVARRPRGPPSTPLVALANSRHRHLRHVDGRSGLARVLDDSQHGPGVGQVVLTAMYEESWTVL